MLDRDTRNEYRLMGLIDYDYSVKSYTAHVVKSNGKDSWWYTFKNNESLRPEGGIAAILKNVKAPHMLFYRRI